MTHTVAFLVYPEFELLNLAGPASVFDTANLELRLGGKKPLYAIQVISPTGGPVTSSGGITVHTQALARMPATQVHTALIVGAHMDHLLALTLNPPVRRWAIRCAKAATRFGAVCTGAFVLAALGLLDGKRAATHWFGCALLAEKYPSVSGAFRTTTRRALLKHSHQSISRISRRRMISRMRLRIWNSALRKRCTDRRGAWSA